MVPLLLGVLLMVFFMLRLIPGSPARRILGEYATPEAVAELEHQLGLDQPLHVQLVDFLTGYLRGDFGRSLRNRRPVFKEILRELPYTVELALGGLLLGTLFGVSMGILSAIRPNSWIDSLARMVALLGVSMPVYWSGMLLILAFCIYLNWFPSIGVGDPNNPLSIVQHLVLPSISIGTVTAALIMRMTRSSMLDIINEDYIRTAMAKGLPTRKVYLWHALRAASIPIVTIVGLNFGSLLGGAVLTETVFARPGLGKLLVDAVLWRDYPMVQGGIFVFAAMFMVVNLITDLTYGILDPRIRLE